MRTQLVIALIVFMVLGSYCKGQELKLKQCANGKYGFIDETGKEVIPCKYDDAYSFSEGLALVNVGGTREISELEYDSNTYILFYGGKYGFIDKTGAEIIPLKYDHADNFSDGLARVELDGKYGFVNKTGVEIIPVKYDYVESIFAEGLIRVILNKKYG
jgi:hypothetical protein